MGRKARINEHPYKDASHLPLLDAVEQTVVRYRWGLTTGSPLTVRQVAEKMGASVNTINRLEKSVLKKIEDHIGEMIGEADEVDQPEPDIATLMKRIEQLEYEMAGFSIWKTNTIAWQKTVKVRRWKKK